MSAGACVCAATFRELTPTMSCHALAAHPVHLQGPDQPLRVIGVDTCRGLRVDFGQLAVQLGQAQGFSLRFQLGAHRRIGGRHIGQAIDQRLVIEHGAADQQRDLAARGDLGHGLQRVGTELRGGIALRRVANVDQPVRVGSEDFFRRLGRTDIHATVHKCRIDADQFTRQHRGQFDGKVGLAGRRRTHQEYCRGLAAHFIDRAGKVCPDRPGPSESR
ncbi:hypothetical protein D3C79_523240 [compost metagenome]